MNARWVGAIGAAVTVWLVGGVSTPAQAPGPVRQVPSGNQTVTRLNERLAALSPREPLAYFELAEEVAYEMPFGAGQDLARTLFVLSFELDRRSERPIGIGGSVCLALAELSTDVSEQRWLHALAEALQGSLRTVRWASSFTVGGSDRAPLDLAEAMGRARGGDVRQLRSLLSRLDVEMLLRDAGMKADDGADFADHLEAVMSRLRARPPSREIRKSIDGELVVELDSRTGGNPGPSLSEQEFIGQLRAELLLLDGRAGTWASQVFVDGGVPVRDIDPAELSVYFGIDPERSVFRAADGGVWWSGRWVRPAPAPAE